MLMEVLKMLLLSEPPLILDEELRTYSVSSCLTSTLTPDLTTLRLDVLPLSPPLSPPLPLIWLSINSSSLLS